MLDLAQPSTAQDLVFLRSEADAYHARNREALGSQEMIAFDPVLRLLSWYGLPEGRTLEIGAATGWRLAELAKRARMRGQHVECIAVEPSQAAIDEGYDRYGEVTFYRRLASDLPFKDSYFTCVIVSFVLHWEDRARLSQSLTEIDRVLADGGILALADFWPAHPQRVPYQHKPGLYTWKTNYSRYYTGHGYDEIARLAFDHDTHEYHVDPPLGARAAASLLRKWGTEMYR
jgi:ubiquinone/menaquinone biosynthesis C-methylase UbiE